jgi:tagatose-1,6-bisphosphate aldolase non-catalytic subunit AgaZ/GatZ
MEKAQKKPKSSDIAGVTRDGVAILKVGRATHFTDRELASALKKVLRDSGSGQFAKAKRG